MITWSRVKSGRVQTQDIICRSKGNPELIYKSNQTSTEFVMNNNPSSGFICGKVWRHYLVGQIRRVLRGYYHPAGAMLYVYRANGNLNIKMNSIFSKPLPLP